MDGRPKIIVQRPQDGFFFYVTGFEERFEPMLRALADDLARDLTKRLAALYAVDAERADAYAQARFRLLTQIFSEGDLSCVCVKAVSRKDGATRAYLCQCGDHGYRFFSHGDLLEELAVGEGTKIHAVDLDEGQQVVAVHAYDVARFGTDAIAKHLRRAPTAQHACDRLCAAGMETAGVCGACSSPLQNPISETERQTTDVQRWKAELQHLDREVQSLRRDIKEAKRAGLGAEQLQILDDRYHAIQKEMLTREWWLAKAYAQGDGADAKEARKTMEAIERAYQKLQRVS